MEIQRPISVPRALAGPFTFLSLGAAAIHFAVVPEHFEEWWAFGLFFVTVGWFQALWPMAYLVQPSRQLVWLGIGVNLATVFVWVWSRTAGLPFGPEAGIVENVGSRDLLASVFELVLVAGLLVTLAPGGRRLAEASLPRGWLAVWTTGVIVLVVVSTTLVLASGSK
jgi:hypothetical protein